jgi:hypothetical protein
MFGSWREKDLHGVRVQRKRVIGTVEGLSAIRTGLHLGLEKATPLQLRVGSLLWSDSAGSAIVTIEPPSSDRPSAHPSYRCVLHAQTPFLFSKVFALCRSADRIGAISIKNGLICGPAEVLGDDRSESQDAFQSILDCWPADGPSRMYWKRCQDYLFDAPPAPWHGVFAMTHK